MSYILDALKRSQEKRGDMPAASIQQASILLDQPRHRRLWLPIMLAVTALIVGWFIARWQAVDMQYERALPTLVGTQESERLDRVRKSDPLAKPLPTRALYLTQPPNSAVTGVQTEKPVFQPISPASPVSRMHIAPPVKEETQSVQVDGDGESVFDLPLAEQQSMPAITIEGHIYDADPQARMVIINGNVRKEKQHISAGLVLQEITPDGVILDYHGHVFRMGVFDHQAGP